MKKTLKTVTKAAGNIVEKPSQEIGQGFTDIFYMIFHRIHRNADSKRLLDDAYHRYLQELLTHIERIPDAHLKDPDLQKVANALVDSKFCVEKEEIRKMFVNLISAAMDDQLEELVHPSFSTILKQMDTLDARNLKLFSGRQNYPIVHYQISYRNHSETMVKNVFLENPDCQDIFQQSRSVSCLENLGLVKVYEDTYFFEKNEDNYKKYYETEFFRTECRKREDGQGEGSCVVYETYVEITPVGADLLRVCLERE